MFDEIFVRGPLVAASWQGGYQTLMGDMVSLQLLQAFTICTHKSVTTLNRHGGLCCTANN